LSPTLGGPRRTSVHRPSSAPAEGSYGCFSSLVARATPCGTEDAADGGCARMRRPFRALSLNRFVILPLAAVVLVALAVFVATAAVGSATDRARTIARSSAPSVTDPRGFPRTFS